MLLPPECGKPTRLKHGAPPAKKEHSTAYSHTFTPLSNPVLDVAELAREAAALVESLVLHRFGPEDAGADFAGLEGAVGEIAAAAGRSILRSLIEARDVAEPRPAHLP